MPSLLPPRFARTLALPALLLLLTGCALAPSADTSVDTSSAPPAAALTGVVHGGQQPISGAVIGMYAVGTTGYGSPASSLLNPGVTITSATGTGSFDLTGKFTCGSPDQRIFFTARGGDSGSGNNPAIALISAFGRCADFTSSTFIDINEVSTAASVTALAPFTYAPTAIGAPLSNQLGLNDAFDDVQLLVNTATGRSPGPNLPAGTSVPVSAIYTLADILAACVNTSGPNSGPCTTLFSASSQPDPSDPNPPPGPYPLPSETLTAMLDIALHPSRNTSMLSSLISASPPFQPTLNSFPDFTLAVVFSDNFLQPSSLAIDAAGSAWILDYSGNSLTVLAHNGTPLFSNSSVKRANSIAIDPSGNAWIANSANSITRITPANIASTFTGGGLSIPKSIALDGQGNIWVANYGNNSVSEFSPTGAALTPASGFPVPAGPAIALGLNPN